MIPGPPIKSKLLNKQNPRINSRNKSINSPDNNSVKQIETNKKLPSSVGNSSPEERGGSSISPINSSRMLFQSKYTKLPDIKSNSQDGDGLLKGNINNSKLKNLSNKNSSEKSLPDPELIVAIRFPSGRKIIKNITDQTQNLIELITDLGIENKERLDIDYLQCLNAAVSDGPKIYSDDQMKTPIRDLKIQNKSLLIFQYSD